MKDFITSFVVILPLIYLTAYIEWRKHRYHCHCNKCTEWQWKQDKK